MLSYTQPYDFRSLMTLLKSVWLTGWLAALFHSSAINAIVLNISHPYSNDLRYLLTNEYHQWSTNTSINFAGSSDFFTSTERWTTFSAPTYAAVISPGTEEDVAKIVRAYPFRKCPAN
jgi:hypothetical protein